jgi:hypothetical protein
MSKQLDVAKKVWADNRNMITNRILAAFDQGWDFNSFADQNILFLPWENTEYDAVMGELGNDEDDTAFLSNVWCHVLLTERPIGLHQCGGLALALVRKLLEVNVEGL